MPKFKRIGRVSRLQKEIFRSLKRRSLDYEDLREEVMGNLKIRWEKEESFKASFSRSLKNLEQKHLIKRNGDGWCFGRTIFSWENICITKRGWSQIVSD